MASRQDSEDSEDYGREDDGDQYDYNNGIPPNEGDTWDDEFRTWVSDPFDMDQIDEEGNYRIPPEDIVVEPTPAAALAAAAMPAARQPQESRIDQFRRRRRERARAYAPAPMPAAVLIPTPPAPPTEDPSIVAARIGLPAGWEPLKSRSTGRIYFYNKNTRHMQYEVPTDDPLIVEASIGLPAGWVPLKSRSTGKIYFYNQNTGVKQVKRPTMGGKRTKRRQRSRAKRPKRKRSTRRRKRTTTRRK
jgi:hypothetical protein